MGGKKYRTAVFAVVVVIIALAIPYFAFDRETTTLTKTTRKGRPGSFITLSDGVTHYEWQGSDTGPVVVLIHGLTTPMYNWDKTVPAIAAAGFRVLRYDLFGRGLSDRPVTDYNEDLFDRQLMALLRALNIARPVRLVGLSMGGTIATIFAARHPESVDALVLVSPVGFPVPLPFTSKLVRLPLLGAYIMKAAGDRTLVKNVRKSLFQPEKVPEYMEKYQEQLVYKGYKRAIASTLRHFDMNNQQAAFETAGRHPRPVLVFWGRQDAIIPFENSEKVRKAIPNARLVAIDGAGHNSQYEKADVINPIMVNFLKGKTKKPEASS